jgi:hypothetical protein
MSDHVDQTRLDNIDADQGALAKALAGFQAEVPTVVKTRTARVGQYSYTYAGLAEVSTAALPLLAKHGLAFTCSPRRTEAGGYELVGMLIHSSGEQVTGVLPIPGGTPQQLGSAITYARRYLLGALTGVVTDDDDDGQAAGQQGGKRAERVRAAPTDDGWYDTPPTEPGDRQVTAEQLKKLHACFTDLGVTERDLRLAYANDVLGLAGDRALTSSNQLTRSQASKVIDAATREVVPR